MLMRCGYIDVLEKPGILPERVMGGYAFGGYLCPEAYLRDVSVQ